MKGSINKTGIVGFLIIGLFAVSCAETEKPKEWVYQKTIKLDGVNPIGLANNDDGLWLSDGDHNRVVLIDGHGRINKAIDSFDRPMHIDVSNGKLFIPQYGNDKVETYDSKGRLELKVGDSLDAPASISVYKDEIAIADFYNNRIVYRDFSFGREGSGEGQFYYPTDVQITDSLIWVADAYNHRIQVFDKKGNFLRQMGRDQKMNAATGLFVSDNEVFITDFENDRVLVFDFDGNVKQILDEGIEKATDVLVKDGLLHIVNYRLGELVFYELKEKLTP